MGLRPAHTCRDLGKTPWTRYSKRKPRKSFVKAMPHLSLLVYEMGDRKQKFDYTIDLVSKGDVQLRDNTLEAARQAAMRNGRSGGMMIWRESLKSKRCCR